MLNTPQFFYLYEIFKNTTLYEPVKNSLIKPILLNLTSFYFNHFGLESWSFYEIRLWPSEKRFVKN